MNKKLIHCGYCGKKHMYNEVCEITDPYFEYQSMMDDLKKLKPKKEVIIMAKLNKKVNVVPNKTHEGGVAARINAYQALRRSVCSCLLWEDSFYEDGISIAERIAELVKKVAPEKVADLAIEAREAYKLRHVPLLLTRELARARYNKTADTLVSVIQRADELAEFMKIYWKDGKEPVSAQVKKGLAKAFTKFNEYHLAKYNRDAEVKLRDVLFVCHAKPIDEEQAKTFKKLVDGTLATPDTWETNLSAGKDKKETFERLMAEKKLGALAFLRNLRNMDEAGIIKSVINEAIQKINFDRVLPYRFIAAAKAVPRFEDVVEPIMLKSVEKHPKMKGHTVLLVDVSGSMDSPLSGKSDLMRLEAVYGLAILLREICEEVTIYSFSEYLKLIPSRRGFALRDAINKSQSHGGTPLGEAIDSIYADKGVSVRPNGYYGYKSYVGQGLKPDRLIVITDEQACDTVHTPKTGVGYMINVASYKHGVGYGKWNHVDGFSEAVIDWIMQYEALEKE